MTVISTGVYPIDKLLNGGIEKDIITSFYGPAASGKTNIAIISSYNISRTGKKVIYIDTEGGFSFERLKQISKEDFDNVMKNILIYKPVSFLEQRKSIFLAYDYIKNNSNSIGLLVIDSISMLYRLEKGDEDVNEVNTELARQLQVFSEINRKYNIPVIVTNQVYSLLDQRDKIGIVGGDLIKYWSKCLIELKVYENGVREAILKRHRYLPEGLSIKFKIINDGIIEYKE
ncbi:DNA repair and recombination protein RadB [Nanobdella aerobiophila]|uniref:DNA repair and recombination protein RadB n=1 Tax=Nanobdella aerobiophila TaxID=2586965 RepID=A0A915WSY8_9ARCH|nr:DNA repair and recombination protein RadB [Nanobdella aerobiophila]BBL45672.1 DNA repair and recombination protein RadB [Nanobdella aerobiophila]